MILDKGEIEVELPLWTNDLDSMKCSHINVSIDDKQGNHLAKAKYTNEIKTGQKQKLIIPYDDELDIRSLKLCIRMKKTGLLGIVTN